MKHGQSRWFIGSKKHTLRLWLCQHADRILLVPLVSWAGPAHRGEARFFLSFPGIFPSHRVSIEILYGTIPLSARVAQQLLVRARPWIEATQSYEKNQLGLSQLFPNSLRLAWIMSLLADTVALRRARAVLTRPQARPLLHEIAPTQMALDLA